MDVKGKKDYKKDGKKDCTKGGRKDWMKDCKKDCKEDGMKDDKWIVRRIVMKLALCALQSWQLGNASSTGS